MGDRITGKQSYWNFNGTSIPITKLNLKAARENADATDSGDYNATNDIIFPTQLPVSTQVTASIEGRFRKSAVPSQLWAQVFTGLTAVPCTFGADLQSLHGHGNFDISNIEIDSPVNDTCTYTAEIVSNGQFYPNA